jgi:uncharacterized membrane protein
MGNAAMLAVMLVAAAAAGGAAGTWAFMRYLEPRRHRWKRIALDVLGVVTIIPAIVMFYALADTNSGGQMTGFAALLIYSLVTLGLVPLLGFVAIILTFRLAVRLKRLIQG